MIRVALILQVILGLIVGPNCCCCTANRIAAIFLGEGDAHADSCCHARHVASSNVASCDSDGCCESLTEPSHQHSFSLTFSGTCCSQPNSCLCVAAIRPSIHRIQIDIDPIRTMTDDGMVIAWRAASDNSMLVLDGTSFRSCSHSSDQPSRACAVAFQRWNC